jgi:hypothetical protein
MAVRPALSTTTGFFFDTRLATSAKARPSFRSSQCCTMICVWSSCSKNVNRSSSQLESYLKAVGHAPELADGPDIAESPTDYWARRSALVWK